MLTLPNISSDTILKFILRYLILIFLVFQSIPICTFWYAHKYREVCRLDIIISSSVDTEKLSQHKQRRELNSWEQTPWFHYCFSFMLRVGLYEGREKLKSEEKNLLLILHDYINDYDSERHKAFQCLSTSGNKFTFSNIIFKDFLKSSVLTNGRES